MKTARTFIIAFSTLSVIQAYSQNKNQKMENKNYSVEIIRYNIPDSARDKFETAYTEAGKYLQASKFCLGYEVIHGNEEPNHYIVIINWTSKDEHLQGFRKSPEFGGFFNLVKPFFNSIEEMKHYDLTPNKWTRN